MKHWAKEKVEWSHLSRKPKSYLLSLLVVRAAEKVSRTFSARENTINRKIGIIGALARLVQQDRLNIAWSKYYDLSYQYLPIWNAKRIIRDPANPANNVADSGLTDWSQFIPEVVGLARSLGQNV
ncbi:uncharacterized protein LOC134195167 [Corticium candelabrum]|uniref:uncharacterized protein LOC134195167 n=1 Tax=Corticium candelabrum TaxID=121492 RepID=UPI002E2677D8|nr:uncharacterized protein LOC134195167 [Corticium candelabrum]